MNETDPDMGAVTAAPGPRPWTLLAAAGLLWLVAAAMAGAGLWGAYLAIAGRVDSPGAAAGVIAAAALLALLYWFLGRGLLLGRNRIGPAVFQALLWLPVGYYLRDAAHPVLGLGAWALAAAMLALLLAPQTRRAVGFGVDRPSPGEDGDQA